jgi:hypothetical protein
MPATWRSHSLVHPMSEPRPRCESCESCENAAATLLADMMDTVQSSETDLRVAERRIAAVQEALLAWASWGDRPARDLIDRLARALTDDEVPA